MAIGTGSVTMDGTLSVTGVTTLGEFSVTGSSNMTVGNGNITFGTGDTVIKGTLSVAGSLTVGQLGFDGGSLTQIGAIYFDDDGTNTNHWRVILSSGSFNIERYTGSAWQQKFTLS